MQKEEGIMGFGTKRILLHFMATLMFMPQMRNLDGASSSASISAIVAAFDAALLSNALRSFVTRDGGKDEFDLVICISEADVAENALEEAVLGSALEFRTILSNCSEITPPSPSDYNQILYIFFPENNTDIGATIEKISTVYHIIKKTFHSTRVAKLLWMPLFLVIWPNFEDYCQNETVSKRLFQSYSSPSVIPTNDNEAGNVDGESKKSTQVYESFSVNSDVYIYFGSECDDLQDNVLEVYSLSNGIVYVQKLIPDNRKYESMFEGILGRVRRRMNLHNSTIRAINSRDPSSFLEGPGEDVFDPLEIVNGTPQVVFSELQQSLNFSKEMIVSDWISRYPNSTLKGKTVNLFRDGMADITISVSSLLPYRKVELSFLQPTYANSVNGFFVQPAASTLRDIVIKPFSSGLWISLFIIYMILIVSIMCFKWIYGKVYRMRYQGCPPNDSTFTNELVIWAVGAVTQQGWYKSPASNSIRMAFILGYYLGLVCYGAFSAAIVAILAVELVPIRTRSDLLQSELTFYADDASSTMAYVVDPSPVHFPQVIDIFFIFLKFLQQNTNANFGRRVNLKEGVARLQSKNPSCYIAFPHYFYLSALNINISESWICGHLSVIPVTTVATPSSMVVPRHSAYAELFNFMILKMKTRGLNYRFVHLYNEKTTAKCSRNSVKIFYSLGIKDVFTAGLILFAGMVLATVLLFLERALQIIRTNCIYTKCRTITANNNKINILHMS